VTTRAILRIVFVIVAVAVSLYLLYLLRRPISWIVIALFIAVALSGPVNLLNRYMKRGFAITLVYLGMLLVPVLIGALVVPSIVTQGNNLARDLPGYAEDVQSFVRDNPTLRSLEEDYDVTGRLQEQAQKIPEQLDDAAGILSDIGFGLVNSIFAGITILVLTAFMLGSGPVWREKLLTFVPSERRERIRRALEHMGKAVGGYVGGALLQALVAGVTAYIVLTILGVPFRAPLALLVALMDLIPLVGATIGAVLVGIVTLFNDFPTATIVWTAWSIVYQQIENTVIQPRIQQRAVNVHPFVVLVAVLFGATLLGVLGALLAIPAAASIQIAINEWWTLRREQSTVQPPSTPLARPA
jgi:predicted PurR-regulated permease PerM